METFSWINVRHKQPSGSPLVFMYSKSNKEFSYGHFTLSRAEVPVTHWMPAIEPINDICPKCFDPDCSGHYGSTKVYGMRRG